MSSVQILKVENVNVEIFSRLEEKRVEENNSILSPLCGNNRSYIDTPLLFLRHKQGFSRFRIHFQTSPHLLWWYVVFFNKFYEGANIQCQWMPAGPKGLIYKWTRRIRTQSKNLKNTHPGFTVKMWKDAYFRAVRVMN